MIVIIFIAFVMITFSIRMVNKRRRDQYNTRMDDDLLRLGNLERAIAESKVCRAPA